MEPPAPLAADLKILAYIAVSSLLGILSALASLLGSADKPLSVRVVSAYLIAGGLVSSGITFLLVQHYGFSYFLLGVSIFAGYKAFDILAFVGLALSGAVSSFVKRFFNTAGKK